MIITLRDDTTGTDVISRIYNAGAGAGGGGVDTRFTAVRNLFYTSQWQIEQLVIDQALAGHDFTLSLLAADCLPSGHAGYVYLDGFGGVLPDPGAPGGTVLEPGTTALLGLGLFGFVASRRKSAKSKSAKAPSASSSLPSAGFFACKRSSYMRPQD